jgi:hypothetical protein
MLSRLPVLILLAVVLTGCKTEPPPARLPDMTFVNLPKILIDVAQIEIVDTYSPPFAPPNVEHKMPVPPAGAARRWAQDRLVAVGQSGRAVVTIKDAHVTETLLAKSTGVTSTFTTQQGARYDGVIEMTVEIKGDRGFQTAAAQGRAVRSQSVPENISPNRLDEVWYEMVEVMMRDINAQLERNMRQFMGRFVTFS